MKQLRAKCPENFMQDLTILKLFDHTETDRERERDMLALLKIIVRKWKNTVIFRELVRMPLFNHLEAKSR